AMALRGRECFHSAAVRVDFVDPVGAGDSFDAGFLARHLQGADLQTCLAWGNLAGAFSTTMAGGTEAFRDRERRKKFWREAGYETACRYLAICIFSHKHCQLIPSARR